MRSLSLKMTLKVWGVTTVLLLAAVGLEYHLDKGEVMRDIDERMRFVASYIAVKYDEGFARAAQLPKMMALNIETHPFAAETEIRRYLERLLAESPDIYGTCIAFEPGAFSPGLQLFAPYLYRKNGVPTFAQLARTSYNYRGRAWYRQVKETGSAGWTEPYFDKGGGETLMVTYATPFRRDGVFAGVAEVDVSLESLAREMARVRVGQSGYGFIVSREGRLVTFPDRTRTMTNLADLDRELAQRLAHSTTGKVETYDPLQHRPAWVVFHPIPSTGFKMAVVYPTHELLARVYAMNRASLLLIVGELLLLLLLVALVSRSIARPISSLAAAARQVASGNLEFQLVEPRSRDEVGVLAMAFNTMIADLRHHIAELQRTTAEKERMSSELRIAHDIQMSILPRTFPPFPENDRFEIYARAIPAREMGGDFYDFFLLCDGRLGFVIADVSDKGVPAALFMAVSRTLVRATALQNVTAGDCLTRVNRLLAEDNASSMFVTLFYGILDTASGEMEFANAGHCPPYLLRGQETQPLTGVTALVLGADEGTSYATSRAHLIPGDLLFLYTDGITEAMDRDNDLFAETKLVAALRQTARKPVTMVDDVVEAVRRHAGETPQFDDITALALLFHGTRSA
jgi:phosphoserine phosphatase RsbU/P